MTALSPEAIEWRVAPGLLPYQPNLTFWSDHALKRRWFTIPDASSKMTWSRDGEWTFPAGQIWVKHFDIETTRDYYSKQSEQLNRLIRILGIVIGSIMAIGAVFGALNTMYAAVAGRAREIATMRAIGFRGLPVVAAVMLETMLLAFLGGLLGAALAWVVFNGYTVSTLGQNFSQVVFQFRVSPELLWTGLKWALGIGLVGGLFPALRAARLPVTEALRAA